MKPLFILSVVFVLPLLSAFAQKSAVVLTFTATDNGAYVQLDSIRVMNRSQGGYTMIYHPDTTCSMNIIPGEDEYLFIGYSTGTLTGIPVNRQEEPGFKVLQINPNPVKDEGTIRVQVPAKGDVDITVSDIRGRVVHHAVYLLNEGTHAFLLKPGNTSMLIFSARRKGLVYSTKILANENGSSVFSMEYAGKVSPNIGLKHSPANGQFIRESGILDRPENNESYTFQFATNIPCPGTPTVDYEGTVCNTIQVCSQCWLKENLNAGARIPVSQAMADNGILEKYCYNDDNDSCLKYGGLYTWHEMMQYNLQEPCQGICPPGWHLPSDEEWKVLEGAVDSVFGIGDPEWDDYDNRGSDAGTNLKTTSGWLNLGNGNDRFGFSGMPGGFSKPQGIFEGTGDYAFWWSSTAVNAVDMWYRYLSTGIPVIMRYNFLEGYGYSVRCIKDNQP